MFATLEHLHRKLNVRLLWFRSLRQKDFKCRQRVCKWNLGGVLAWMMVGDKFLLGAPCKREIMGALHTSKRAETQVLGASPRCIDLFVTNVEYSQSHNSASATPTDCSLPEKQRQLIGSVNLTAGAVMHMVVMRQAWVKGACARANHKDSVLAIRSGVRCRV